MRFFRYLLLAWGAFTLSKGLKLVDVFLLHLQRPSFATDLTSVAAVGFTLAAAMAHRWDYRLRGRGLAIGAAAVAALALVSGAGGGETGEHAVGLILGVVQMGAGVLFWPAPGRSVGFRGERLLAGLFALWGVHRIGSQFVSMEIGAPSYMLVHAVFITLYFPSAGQDVIDFHNEHFQTLGPVPNMMRMIELASWIDVREELGKVRAPTLVCHARLDGNAPLSAGRQVAERIAGSRFVEVDSANHILLGDEPAWGDFVREFRWFLGEQQPHPVIPAKAGT